MDSEPRIQTYREFWPYYVGEHSSPACRALHYLGSVMGLSTLAALALTGDWRWLLVGLVAGYGPAWVGHFFIEKNRPATFRYPLWSLISDYRMLALALRGEMADETRRRTAEPRPRAT